jgi:hypothetical protein
LPRTPAASFRSLTNVSMSSIRYVPETTGLRRLMRGGVSSMRCSGVRRSRSSSRNASASA